MEISEFKQKISQKSEDALQLAAAAASSTADASAAVAAESPDMVATLVEGLDSRNTAYRYRCYKIANLLCAQKPAVLYPYFEKFVRLLESHQNIPKWNAIDILANLTSADKDDKFSSIYSQFYRLLEEGSLITAGHVVESSAVIAMNRPQNEKEITATLLKVESIPLPTEECRNILRGKTIETFARYARGSSQRAAMLNFALQHIQNSRSGTAKKAQNFVNKFGSKR